MAETTKKNVLQWKMEESVKMQKKKIFWKYMDMVTEKTGAKFWLSFAMNTSGS